MVDSSGNRSLRGFKNIGQELFGEVVAAGVRRVIFRAWFRLRTRGLVPGLFQRRFLLRAVVGLANCAWMSGGCTLVVQRVFRSGLRLFVMF